MARLLFVVHRYVPFPGGSEYYVRDMAEEAQRRGHEVAVYTHQHQGNQNGVRVTNDHNILVNEAWDLIVVHGGDCSAQNVVHANPEQIKRAGNRVLYLLIKPSDSQICVHAIQNHDIIGYSTRHDVDHIRRYDALSRARRVRHGIDVSGPVFDQERAGSDQCHRPYISCGGFSSHKGHRSLSESFSKFSGRPDDTDKNDRTLELYGYHQADQAPDPVPGVVTVHKGDRSRAEVNAAIRDSTGYILNSYEEGFGLVLLEAMALRVPWFARRGVGAVPDLERYGVVYDTEDELMKILSRYERDEDKIERAYQYVMREHTIQKTVDDIEDCIS